MKILQNWLGGVGGFADEIETMILVTAKESCYLIDEQYQYVVSSSILAGYLSLALEATGIGACVIQRPVIYSKEWNRIRTELKIPGDEQIICILGCGMPESEYRVPLSYRLPVEDIAVFHRIDD